MGDSDASKPKIEVPQSWEKCEIAANGGGQVSKENLINLINYFYRIEMNVVFCDPHPASGSILIKKSDIRAILSAGGDYKDKSIALMMREMLTEMTEKFPEVKISLE